MKPINATIRLTNGHEMFITSLQQRTESVREFLLKNHIISKGNCYSFKTNGAATSDCDMAFDLTEEKAREIKLRKDIMEFFGRANYQLTVKPQAYKGNVGGHFSRLEITMR